MGRPDVLVRIGLAAAVLVIRIPTLAEPPWYTDDGFFTAGGWAMSKGLTLYAGVYDDQPPGIYWLFRLLVLFGADHHHIVVQLAATAFVIATALLTLSVARTVLPLWPAALAGFTTGLVLSLPTLDGDLFNVELGALPFFLGALRLSFSQRRMPPLVAGALLGIAVIFRPSFLFDGLALLVPLISSGRRVERLGLTAAGGAIAAAVTVAALAASGSLNAYLTVILPADHRYLVDANGGTLLPMYARLAALLLIAIAFLLRSRSLTGRLISVWVPASIAGASLTPLGFTHYAHEAVPAFAFAIAVVAARTRMRWNAAAGAPLALVLGCELLLIVPEQTTALMNGTPAPRLMKHNFDYQNMPLYYGNWLAFVLGQKSATEYAGWFSDTNKEAAEDALLRRISGGRARLLVLGNRPWIYVDSGLLPATRYLASNTSFTVMPSGPTDVASCIRDQCADIVVWVGGPNPWAGDLTTTGYTAVDGAAWPTYVSPRFAPSTSP
jgi:hypothetical protein